jgi:hypothetical protein
VVVHGAAAQGEDFAFARRRHLDVPHLVARLRSGDEVLAPVLDPFQRPAELRRG